MDAAELWIHITVAEDFDINLTLYKTDVGKTSLHR